MCILTTQLGRVIIFVIFRIFQKIHCKKKKKTQFLLSLKMLPGFFHCPGAIQTHNKINLLMCWVLSLAQTEQRKHRNLCPEAEKLTTDTKLLMEGQ